MSLIFPLFVSVFVFVCVFVFVFVFSSKFGEPTSSAFRKYAVWGVPEAWRQCYSSSMNSGKIVVDRWTGRDKWTSKVLQEVFADLKSENAWGQICPPPWVLKDPKSAGFYRVMNCLDPTNFPYLAPVCSSSKMNHSVCDCNFQVRITNANSRLRYKA